MRFLTLLTIVVSLQSIACSGDDAFHIGFNAIIEKYPEYRLERDIFTVEEREKIWLILRKQSVFKAAPKEYLRAVLNKETCEVERVLWSK